MIKYEGLTLRNLLRFMLFTSMVAILFAYNSEYFFNFKPCNLCLQERKPFFVMLFLLLFSSIFLNLFKVKKMARVKHERRVFFICIAALLINCAISFYHVGVEKKIFEEPNSCSSKQLNQYDNIDDLKNAVADAKLAKCSDPTYILPFLSMAMLNFIYCLLMVIGCIFFYNKIPEIAEYKFYQQKIYGKKNEKRN